MRVTIREENAGAIRRMDFKKFNSSADGTLHALRSFGQVDITKQEFEAIKDRIDFAIQTEERGEYITVTRLEKIVVPEAVMEGLEFVRGTGLSNMFDVNRVIGVALDYEYFNTARWIEENRHAYLQGIFAGFVSEVDQQQKLF